MMMMMMMMAASTWRMNGLWRRTTVVLVLCTLFLSNNVICQEDATQAPDIPTAVSSAGSIDATTAPVVTGPITSGDSAATHSGDSAASLPQDAVVVTTPMPIDVDNSVLQANDADSSPTAKTMVPKVKCVGKDEIPENKAVKAVVLTEHCEATKEIIENNAAKWCHSEDCSIKIFQEGNTMLLTSSDADMETLQAALQSDQLKSKLGVTETKVSSASSNSSVFPIVLVTGLLSALGITVGYFKCPRRTGDKAVRLAEEAYPVDQETQASTLASAAPLNPPPETEEKPTENGDSTEPAKTEPAPPPTNGHSAPKTADTEL